MPIPNSNSCMITDLPTDCFIVIIETLCYNPDYGGTVCDHAYRTDVYPFFLAIPSIYSTLKTNPRFRDLVREAEFGLFMTNFYHRFIP